MQPLTPSAPKAKLTWNYGKPPRASQQQALDWLVEAEQPLLSISAPVGAGKSAIAASLASSRTGVVLVPQKMLQDQYLRDWPEAALLKGAANYQCKGADNCRIGAKLSRVKNCRRTEPCAFTSAKASFLASRFGITNYACYFATSLHDPNFAPEQRYLVCDEAHNLDGALVGAATMTVVDEQWTRATRTAFAPPLTVSQAQIQLRALVAGIKALIDSLGERVGRAELELVELSDMAQLTLESIESGDTPWVVCRERRRWSLKPLSSAPLYQRFLSGQEVLLMSATPPPKSLTKAWCRDAGELELEHSFPLSNRKVRFMPVASLNRNNLEQMLPKLLQRVRRILDHHAEDKGIIHCNSYALCQELLKLNDPRLLVQDSTNRQAILELHHASERPTVLVSPSMTEGIDLHDDLGRFNVILKVPYPSLGDAWVKARFELDKEWYAWCAARDSIQASGRTTRHEQDWSVTYILDGAFGSLHDRHPHLFPAWFTRSITD